jgi:hypothetical protein
VQAELKDLKESGGVAGVFRRLRGKQA